MKEKDKEERDYCGFPRAETIFSPIEELTLSQEMGVRKLVQRLTKLFRIPSISEGDMQEALPGIIQGLDYYASSKWERVPELFFRPPEKMPLVAVSSPVPLSHGEVRDISFRTKFESTHPDFSFPRCANGDAKAVRARHWVHAERPAKGCIVAIHGWMLGDQKASALTMVPGYFYRMGLDVLVVELPLHGSREPEQYTPASMFPSIDPRATNEYFAQAIYELRELKAWVCSEYSVPIIPVGLSLGAQVAALWASLDKLDGVILAAPLVSLSSFIWGQIQETPLSSTLMNAGINEEVLERAFAPCCPLSFQLQALKDNTLILAGEKDSIVPATQARELWTHWGKPHIHWLKEGHIEQLVDKASGKKVFSFLKKRGFASEAPLSVLRIKTELPE